MRANTCIEQRHSRALEECLNGLPVRVAAAREHFKCPGNLPLVMPQQLVVLLVVQLVVELLLLLLQDL